MSPTSTQTQQTAAPAPPGRDPAPASTRSPSTHRDTDPADDASRPVTNRGARAVGVGLLVVISSLLVAITSGGVWLRNTVLDTDDWVRAVEPLPQDERVANAVAGFIASELVSVSNAQTEIENALRPIIGDDTDLVVPPIVDALEPVVHDAAREIIETEEFAEVWAEINRIAHEEAVLLLRGDGDEVTSADGVVQLNVVPIINRIVNELSKDASALFGSDVQIPEVSSDDLRLPEAARNELEQATGITLPEDFGTVTVFRDDRLAEVQTAVRWTDDLLWTLGLVAVIAIVGALALSKTRRRTLGMIGIGTAVVAAGLYLIADVVENDIVKHIDDPSARVATDAAIDVALLRGLEGHFGWTIALALLVAATTWLLGTGRRETLVAFTGRNAGALQMAGVVIAGVVLLSVNSLTWATFLTVTILLAIFVALAEYAHRHVADAAAPDAVADPSHPTTPPESDDVELSTTP